VYLSKELYDELAAARVDVSAFIDQAVRHELKWRPQTVKNLQRTSGPK
jgi:post-segregation antitoxin (ccd killing protein)